MVIVTIKQSKIDRNGNVYTGFFAQNTATGATVAATISGGESNITCALRDAFDDWETMRQHVYTHVETLPIRQYDRWAKGLPYAGCTSNDIVPFLIQHLGDFTCTVSRRFKKEPNK